MRQDHSSSASAQLLVSGSDIFALGHYPGNPIYPGVLILDRLCALAESLACERWNDAASVQRVKRIQYLGAVLPGDVVELSAMVKASAEGELEVSVAARVRDRTTTRATLVCRRGHRPSASVDVSMPAAAPALSHRELFALLPHRYPFLMLDSVQSYEAGQSIHATRVLSAATPLFAAGAPASYPASLVIESIGQAGIALFFLSRQGQAPADVVLGSLGDAELPLDIPFNCVLHLESRLDRVLPNAVVMSGSARVGNECVVRVGNLVAMLDPR